MKHVCTILPLLAIVAFVAAQEPAALPAPAVAPAGNVLGLADLVRISLDQHPALRQAGLDIEAARGRAVQAGLYPNPTVSVVGEELGGRDGPGGFITAPMVSQEIVTAGKLKLSRAVEQNKVDQAGLALVRERFHLLTSVRQGYFDVLAAQRRVELLTRLASVSAQALDKTRQLLEAKQVAELDLLQFQVERDRFQAELEAGKRELSAARNRLTAGVGDHRLALDAVSGSLEAVLPTFDFESARHTIVEEHPEILSAKLGVTRAELALRREQVERVPNVTVAAGYTRDNIGRQNEWTFQVGVPVPVFNRNQGNIQTAHAEVGHAAQEVARVENELVSRLATAFGEYSAARERAERYRTAILPVAERTFKLSLDAFKGGQFEFVRVLQVQRSLAEADLEYNRALLETWRAASVIAGLLLEEHWPAGFGCGEAVVP